MGYGSYSHDAHVAMTSARAAQPAKEVFTQSSCHPLMNPKGVRARECRDSAEHPNSVGIVFALDVSGSMGEIPKKLATETLPAFMKTLLEAGVPDPQVLFMGVGCARGDRAALQVGQFESTEKLMDQWLTWLYLEGGGGGGNESYELAMYFAARHTDMDCVRKRNRKGFLFLTGDEPPNPAVSKEEVAGLIADGLGADIPLPEIVAETMRSFEPFYLIPDLGRAANVGAQWKQVLGVRTIAMHSPDDTSHVAAGLVALVERAVPNLSVLLSRYRASGLSQERCEAVADALRPFAASVGLAD
ncbi:MAG: hypothetical protein U0230_09995 [Polyangiales bacterium]